ncbi:hypothetical protein BY458DRAFT_493941 [Sporodiniella umbellata]|nr:hypothetical protein BY458DRAFT_493941 [Sporodiniella umbellata]
MEHIKNMSEVSSHKTSVRMLVNRVKKEGLAALVIPVVTICSCVMQQNSKTAETIQMCMLMVIAPVATISKQTEKLKSASTWKKYDLDGFKPPAQSSTERKKAQVLTI